MFATLLVIWQGAHEREAGLGSKAKAQQFFLLCSQAVKWMEFFAGESMATKMMRHAGWKQAIRLDIVYMRGRPGKQNPMDLTSPSGMANLSKNIPNMC